jgi:putative transposase
MRRSEFTDSEIIDLLREADAGTPIAQICRMAEVSPRTFYRWRKRFGGLDPGGLAELRALQAENRRLRAVIQDLVQEPEKRPSVATETRRPDDVKPKAEPRVAREFFASLRTGRSTAAPMRKQ